MAVDGQEVQDLKDEASRLYGAGRYDESQGVYKQVLDADREDADAQVGYARCLIAVGKTAEAAGFLEPLVPGAEDARLLGELGRVYYSQARFSEASEILERAAAMLPEDGHIRANYGFSLWESGQRESALDVLREALPLIQDDTTLSANMGQIYLQLGMWNEAVSSFERYLMDHPSDLNRRVMLAYVLNQAGWADESETVLEEILTIDPEFTAAREQLDALRSEQESGGADATPTVGAPPPQATQAPGVPQAPEVVDFEPMSLEVEPEPGDAVKGSADDAGFGDFGDIRVLDEQSGQQAVVQALMEKIAEAIEASDVGKAIEVLEQELAESEMPAEVHNVIAKLQLQMEDQEAAIRHLRAAMDEDPFHPQAHSNLAVLLWQRGELDEAIGVIQKAVELDTEDMDARINLALICHQVALYEEASTLYSQYLEQYPEDIKIRMDLADCFVNLGDTESALREFDTVLLLEPEHELAQAKYDELSSGGADSGEPS